MAAPSSICENRLCGQYGSLPDRSKEQANLSHKMLYRVRGLVFAVTLSVAAITGWHMFVKPRIQIGLLGGTKHYDWFDNEIDVWFSHDLRDEDLARLAGAFKMIFGSTYDTLDLSASEITDSGLRHLRNVVDLEELYLSNTRVTARGLRHLASISNLQSLHLDNTRITEDGFAVLKSFQRLSVVSIHPNQLAESSICHFNKHPVPLQIQLRGSTITDQVMMDLVPKLKLLRPGRLRLVGTQVTDAGWVALQEAVPRLNIGKGGRWNPPYKTPARFLGDD